MRKDQIEILELIEKLEKDQIYLMEVPKTPQQKFLHLFGHRHLLKKKMIHKNIDRSFDLLEGSFAQSSLKLAYAVLCIENQIEVQEGLSSLLTLINGWISYYPTIKGRSKMLIGEIVLQESTTIEQIQGYDLYLNYVNLISLDLWKIFKGSRNDEQFYAERPFKDEIASWNKIDLNHVEASDLLTFVSSCIPKTLINIILQKASLPAQMREKYNKCECLYSNQAVEYYLRSSLRLSLLLKSIFLILFRLELTHTQQKFLMLMAMRYYYIYHFNRRFSAVQIVIYAFNKLSQEVRKNIHDDFCLFLKVIMKLGKEKFLVFLSENSVFLKSIIEGMRKKPMIGYSQESASPYNTIGIGETITVERGATAVRYFQILEEATIFYYRIVVVNLDITLKLYYLGEIGSTKEAMTLLFTQQKKSGTIKNCINAMKKGLYQFEFDNSYSWINSKTVQFQNVVYAPLEIKSAEADEWIEDFYENIYQNVMPNENDIHMLTHKKVEGKREKTNTAALFKNKDTLSVIITTAAQDYHYETDNPERMQEKVKFLIKSKSEYGWIINGKSVTELAQIQHFIRNTQPSNSQEIAQPSQKIDYYQEEQEEENEEGLGEESSPYALVENPMEQSQIFNQAQPLIQGEAKARKGSQAEIKKKPSGQRKEEKIEEISCNINQTEDFYKQLS